MSATKFELDKIRILLDNINNKMIDVRFDPVDFSLEGSSSGLNAFIYSYVRLANFLAEYRIFARNDIIRICNILNGFQQQDSTMAQYIDGDAHAFQEFTVNASNITDDTSSQSIPTIETTNFRVCRIDTENVTSNYTTFLLALSARLVELDGYIEDFKDSQALTGKTATAMQSYWKEVHIPIIKAIDTALWTINDYLVAYAQELNTLINDSLYYVLPQSEMEAAITELTNIRASLAIIVDDVDSRITSYSSLLGVNVTIPNGIPMLDKYQQEANKIQNLLDNIISFESSKVSLVKDYIDDFVTDTTQLISIVESRMEEVGIGNYPPGTFATICNSYNITLLDNGSACEKNFQKYIDAFEASHPEYAEAMNDFLNVDDGTNSLTDDMKARIKYTAYTAPEPYRTIIMNGIMNGEIHIGSLSVGTTPFEQWIYTVSNGKFQLTSHNNVFTNSVNYRPIDYDNQYVENDMSTIWHEMGHGFDNLGNAFWWGSVGAQLIPFNLATYTTYNETMRKEVSFQEAMYYDIFDNPNNPHSIRNIAQECSSTGNLDAVIDAFKNYKYDKLSEEDKKLYREICARFIADGSAYRQNSSSDTPLDNFGGVSDTYGGMTHNGLVQNYDAAGNRSGPNLSDTEAHENNYWSLPTWIGQTEFYAEYFSANVNGNAEKVALMREYYPEACKVADSYSTYLANS